MGKEGEYLYGGLSGAELTTDSFELGEGIVLKRTYAHLMSPCLMAFARPGPEGHHPTPWKAAKGGFGFDIEIEIRVPNTSILSSSSDPRETIWWIVALLRIAQVPFVMVPVISDQSFQTMRKSKVEPIIEPFEVVNFRTF